MSLLLIVKIYFVYHRCPPPRIWFWAHLFSHKVELECPVFLPVPILTIIQDIWTTQKTAKAPCYASLRKQQVQLPTPWQRVERWKLSYFQAKHFWKAPCAEAFVRKAVCSTVAQERKQKLVVFPWPSTSSLNSCAFSQSTHVSLVWLPASHCTVSPESQASSALSWHFPPHGKSW